MAASINLSSYFYPWVFSSNVQCTNTFRPVNFMRAKSHQVNAISVHINSNFSNRLCCISKKNHVMLSCNLANIFYWLNNASFVISIHNRNQNCFFGYSCFQLR